MRLAKVEIECHARRDNAQWLFPPLIVSRKKIRGRTGERKRSRRTTNCFWLGDKAFERLLGSSSSSSCSSSRGGFAAAGGKVEDMEVVVEGQDGQDGFPGLEDIGVLPLEHLGKEGDGLSIKGRRGAPWNMEC